MSNEFDASLVCEEPVSADVLAIHQQTLAQLMQRPNALANAKLHAEQETKRLVIACNRIAWGATPSELREPSAEEIAALLEQLAPEDRERLMQEARLANEQRHLLRQLEEAHQQCLAQMQAEQEEQAEREAEARERAEFEAHDAAEKEKRFQEWRAARRAQSQG